MKKLKVGVVGIGLDTYWTQFDQLLNHLQSYQNTIAANMQQEEIDIINVGIIDNMDKALIAKTKMIVEEVDIIFLYVSTYALSSTILPLVQQLNKFVVILNIQPASRIDIDRLNSLPDRKDRTGMWLEYCQACAVPELCSVFNRANIRYDIVSGYMQDEGTWLEIKQYLNAAKTKKGLQCSTFGILGHYYNGMLDVYTDVTRQQATFGSNFKMLEMCEVKKYRDEVEESELDNKIVEFSDVFDVSKECDSYEVKRAAQTSVALDRLIEDNDLAGLAYYYEGTSGNEYENIVTSVIAGNTLLTAKGIPVAGECEVKNLIAMKILSLLGAGGSFAEFYALDFDKDIVMLGHDGPAHVAIAEERVGLVPLPIYHGKPGKGLSIQMTVRHGPVTLLSVVESNDGVFLLIAQGESVAGKILQTGNTNSCYKFPISAKEFINSWSKAGPSHHCAIGVGHCRETIEKLAQLLSIPVKNIC
ncbi:L-fucose/L-arabinose isomerase family protein [Dysgonomonas sp. ZJ279]|uniref:L-fucose/L-arabinose isomerase family protein n=1 Tax=Dysgonomonas sp. ZJ279 TaxID=2709796 RepID=UPI0013EE04C0|nr:L-fucose/L-arabinose isomerase family protein [Dysgonomonas sp. ZJ279]